ncbi:DUF2397 domain-containing protein [Streptomyces sp. NBC_00882]|uniref:DUF2397 family protein n=1 Tax=Streptomyces sp. NBC_00882 TaxID=2975856 RepID=UPI003865CDA5|nr:DUF2397 domain-containing protein [Streptomyces sp. NBC_00882]WSZ36916.1 DUF2397 domain-containing protein [Streptomyces sp. NBC_00882]
MAPEEKPAAADSVADAREVVGYLVRPEASDYIAIMDVLEGSVTDLTVSEVATALAAGGLRLDARLVEKRLDALKDIGAASVRSDTSHARRYAEILARNWRYTASPAGRHVQRFYRQVLAGTVTVREIPIVSLGRIVSHLEELAAALGAGEPDADRLDAAVLDAVNAVFTSHDNLDAALVGAEDALIGLADRFDLDEEHTNDLKGLLVDYATRVAAELDSGSARAAAALAVLRPWFALLAQAAVDASQARDLIAVGALSASRGGRAEDWEGLYAWFDARTGRAARFSLRLVRALPSMHANLRRLHSSAGTASTRSRALALARAVLTPQIGVQIFQATLGDHSWRKLYGQADEDDRGRNPSWRGGPQVPVPTLLRTAGRSGPRGRGAAPRDDTAAKAQVAEARARRQAEHQRALAVVLAALPGQQLDEAAARAALAALMAAARAGTTGPRRTGSNGGLACTLLHTGSGTGILQAPTWRVLLPGRIPLFHRPGQRPSVAALAALAGTTTTDDPSAHATLHITPHTGPSTPDNDASPFMPRQEGAA